MSLTAGTAWLRQVNESRAPAPTFMSAELAARVPRRAAQTVPPPPWRWQTRCHDCRLLRRRAVTGTVRVSACVCVAGPAGAVRERLTTTPSTTTRRDIPPEQHQPHQLSQRLDQCPSILSPHLFRSEKPRLVQTHSYKFSSPPLQQTPRDFIYVLHSTYVLPVPAAIRFYPGASPLLCTIMAGH